MIKKIGLIVAVTAAMLVIFAGARTFACGDHGKGIQSTRAPETCTGCAHHGSSVAKASAMGCPGMKAAGASGCAAKGSMASGSACGSKTESSSGCGTMTTASAGKSCCAGQKGAASKASFAANIYQVKDGHRYAVAQGKTFEVNAETPYFDAGPARYYLADKAGLEAVSDKRALTSELDHEAVALATVEGNVTTDAYGKRYAVCPITHERFLVTADHPAKVMDGEKFYVCDEKCWADMTQPISLSQ